MSALDRAVAVRELMAKLGLSDGPDRAKLAEIDRALALIDAELAKVAALRKAGG